MKAANHHHTVLVLNYYTALPIPSGGEGIEALHRKCSESWLNDITDAPTPFSLYKRDGRLSVCSANLFRAGNELNHSSVEGECEVCFLLVHANYIRYCNIRPHNRTNYLPRTVKGGSGTTEFTIFYPRSGYCLLLVRLQLLLQTTKLTFQLCSLSVIFSANLLWALMVIFAPVRKMF